MYATRYSERARLLHGRRRATATRRPTGSARTPRSRTPTTSPGSSRSCCAARPIRRCSTPTTPSARRSAKQIVTRANKTHRGVRADLRGARPARHHRPRGMRANMEARKDATPEAAEQREELRRAIDLKNYEFNAHGVEMNHRYRSTAVVPDGTREPAFDRDPELLLPPDDVAGRAPAARAGSSSTGAKVSTLDLAGKGRFTLLTGIGGDAWSEAAARGRRAHRRRDRRLRDRARPRGARHLRRLGAAARGGATTAACSCGRTRTSPGARHRSPRTRGRAGRGAGADPRARGRRRRDGAGRPRGRAVGAGRADGRGAAGRRRLIRAARRRRRRASRHARQRRPAPARRRRRRRRRPSGTGAG